MIKFIDNDSLMSIDYKSYEKRYLDIYEGMKNKTAKGNDFLGWLDFINEDQLPLIEDIILNANKLQKLAKNMVVIGIGGSYLGSLAVKEAILNQNLNNEYNIFYIGNNISSDYMNEIYEYCQNNDFVINVISKSGTTLEPAIGFRIFKKLLVEKYGEEALKERVIATTDESKGALRGFVTEHDLKSYVINDDIGGRFSVFTAVGLLPLAFLNIDVKSFYLGAKKAYNNYFTPNYENDAFKYAINRFEQYENNKQVEAYVVYDPALKSVIEWIKQLFGESEGKEEKGLLPIGLVNSSDLHSLGQFVQDGSKILFETIIKINNSQTKMSIPSQLDDYDGLNKVCKYDVNQVNNIALEATKIAHVKEGKVANLVVEMDYKNEESIGYLMYFMMLTCAYSAYLLDVNPFNQPGVEVYKKEIFKVLDK